MTQVPGYLEHGAVGALLHALVGRRLMILTVQVGISLSRQRFNPKNWIPIGDGFHLLKRWVRIKAEEDARRLFS